MATTAARPVESTVEPPEAFVEVIERRLLMTYEQWLQWAPESRQVEWVEGEAIEFMPPKTVHARLTTFFDRVLGLYIVLGSLGEFIVAPFEMRLARSAREPDLLFVATANLARLTPERLLGPADLVIELISDDSVGRDRMTKFLEYQEAGVPEYLVIDPRPKRQTFEPFVLNDAGVLVPADLDPLGRYHTATVPGFWLDPNWLWQEPLPDPLSVLRQIAPEAVDAPPSAP